MMAARKPRTEAVEESHERVLVANNGNVLCLTCGARGEG